jgi:hypothetical protein
VLGPHGAGLYNAAIFSPQVPPTPSSPALLRLYNTAIFYRKNTSVLSFALSKEDEKQEDKIVAIFSNEMKMRFRRINVRTPWGGEYDLTQEELKGVVTSVAMELKFQWQRRGGPKDEL